MPHEPITCIYRLFLRLHTGPTAHRTKCDIVPLNHIIMTQTVGVIGAGLVGCLAALAFAEKGFDVSLFELRDDPRKVDPGNLRSINLAVSDRGIRALKSVDKDMAERILKHVIPMYGRMIHDMTGTKQQSQKYGLFGEGINSIDRSFLNKCLLDEIDKSLIKVYYKHRLIEVAGLKSSSPTVVFSTDDNQRSTFDFDYLVGADGAHSQFRYQMQKSMRMNISQEYIDMQYLELSIPPAKDAESLFSIDAHHLHIWPRKNFMLIALPNENGSFTVTFFSPWSVMEELKNETEFLQFFKSNFPDAYDLIGEESLKHAFHHHPRGSLMQVEVYPYHDPSGRAILIGDAAHLMVPFYGQGMNCGFEDVRVLMELIAKHGADAFKVYSPSRRDDLRTICNLALDNYYEMSSKVVSKRYLLRKQIDGILGKMAHGTWWIPLYTMISFRGDIKYSEAVAREKRQSRVLKGIEVGFYTGAILAAAKALHWWKTR